MDLNAHIGRPLRLLLFLLLFSTTNAVADGAAEHAVKAAVAFKITKFVTWPADAFGESDAPIRFCIVGEDSIHYALEELQGYSVRGRPFLVRSIDDPLTTADQCDVLYLSHDSAHDPSVWLEPIASRPILTFGETTDNGGEKSIVNVSIQRNKVQFSINVKSSEEAGLSIGAQLLQLAAVSSRRGF